MALKLVYCLVNNNMFCKCNVVKHGIYVVKHGICYRNVCPSVCHTRESLLNGSRYQNVLCTILQNNVSGFLRPNLAILNLRIHANECVEERHLPFRQHKFDKYSTICWKCKLASINTGWAKKTGPFLKCITFSYNDIGRHSIYQNVQLFIRNTNDILNAAAFKYSLHKVRETILH